MLRDCARFSVLIVPPAPPLQLLLSLHCTPIRLRLLLTFDTTYGSAQSTHFALQLLSALRPPPPPLLFPRRRRRRCHQLAVERQHGACAALIRQIVPTDAHSTNTTSRAHCLLRYATYCKRDAPSCLLLLLLLLLISRHLFLLRFYFSLMITSFNGSLFFYLSLSRNDDVNSPLLVLLPSLPSLSVFLSAMSQVCCCIHLTMMSDLLPLTFPLRSTPLHLSLVLLVL